MAHDLAARLCARDPQTGKTCAWYHGLWQVLRLMHLVETPEYHADFFLGALAAYASGERPARVLVSGTADYSMVAYVLQAFLPGIQPLVTVLDRCETPLALSRWYAERLGCAIETVRGDVLEYASQRPFDAICTHAFIGRFSSEQRAVLARRWRELLRPGGAVVTAAPLRPAASGERYGFGAGQGRKFGELVTQEARAVGLEMPGLREAAELYAASHSVFPVRSAAELAALFEDAGFRIVTLEETPPLAVRHDVRGPTVVGSAGYARLVATPR